VPPRPLGNQLSVDSLLLRHILAKDEFWVLVLAPINYGSWLADWCRLCRTMTKILWGRIHKQTSPESRGYDFFRAEIIIQASNVSLAPSPRQPATHYLFNLCGILYNQYNKPYQHWHQQETDNKNMATMATDIFVTKQQPFVNIIMSITQLVLTIVADAVSLSLIVVLFLQGTIWLKMVSTWWAILRPWHPQTMATAFWSNNGPISTRKILYHGVASKLSVGVTRMWKYLVGIVGFFVMVVNIVVEHAPVENCQRYPFWRTQCSSSTVTGQFQKSNSENTQGRTWDIVFGSCRAKTKTQNSYYF
jgi:hypothetical protein